MIPVIQKIQRSPECFVERRLPKDSGRIFVEKGSKVRPFDFVKNNLTAGVTGEVVKILPQKAVLIKSSGVIVRGVFGHGEDSEGEIIVVTKGDQPLKPDLIDQKASSKILVCGFVTSLEVVKKAEAFLSSGLVCGGINKDILPKTKLAMLVTEGFGRIPLNYRTFEFLKKVESRHVFLSPNHKELLVTKRFGSGHDHPDSFDELPEDAAEAFVEPQIGQMVQVFVEQHFGYTGKIKSIKKDQIEIQLDEGGKIVVPERNLGVIR